MLKKYRRGGGLFLFDDEADSFDFISFECRFCERNKDLGFFEFMQKFVKFSERRFVLFGCGGEVDDLRSAGFGSRSIRNDSHRFLFLADGFHLEKVGLVVSGQTPDVVLVQRPLN